MEDFLNSDWSTNTTRGCSFSFGYRAVTKFLDRNGLLSLVRAHEVQQMGYFEHFNPVSYKKKKSFSERSIPPVITVFSAPNYCDRYGNDAAVLTIHESGELTYKQYSAVEHPVPILGVSKQDEYINNLKSHLPYMPIGFKDFVNDAMSLLEVSVDKSFDSLKSLSPGSGRSLSRSKSTHSNSFDIALGMGHTEAHPTFIRKRNSDAKDLADYLSGGVAGETGANTTTTNTTGTETPSPTELNIIDSLNGEVYTFKSPKSPSGISFPLIISFLSY